MDNWTALEIQSKAQLQTLSTPSILWVAFGALSFINCSIIVAAIIGQKKLRSVYYNTLVHQAAADIFLCGVFFALGLKRTILVLGDGNEITRMVDCVGWGVAMTAALNISAGQTATMALLRLFAMVLPIRYYQLDAKYVHFINFGFWFVGFAVGGAMAFGSKGTAYAPVCLYGLTYQDWALKLSNNVQAAWYVIAGAAGLALCVVLIVKIKAKGKIAGSKNGPDPGLEIKATRTVFLVTIRYIVFCTGPQIVSGIALAVNATKFAALIPAQANTMACMGCSVNMLLYFLTDSEFRKATMMLFGRNRANNVHPMASNADHTAATNKNLT